MIIPDDTIDKKAPSSTPGAPDVTAFYQTSTQTGLAPEQEGGNDDQPPPYSATSSSTNTDTNPADAVDQRPCNFMYMRRLNGSIRDSYTVDPTLRIPSLLLSDLASAVPETQRDNLHLESLSGSIEVNIRIVHGRLLNDEPKKRAKIFISSNNGSIRAKMLPYVETLPKFIFHASTLNGSISIRVPRSFAGPISASTTWGSIAFSSELQKDVTTFSDGNIKKCFVGDFHQYQDSKQEEWDELRLDTRNGSIRVAYVDEENCNSECGGWGSSKSFWGRMFGF